MEFDWDEGNWPKCGKHAMSKSAIEAVFLSDPRIFADPAHSVAEERFKAIGTDSDGRYAFIVFVLRTIHERRCIRPLSARYMHQKEIDHYVRSQT